MKENLNFILCFILFCKLCFSMNGRTPNYSTKGPEASFLNDKRSNH